MRQMPKRGRGMKYGEPLSERVVVLFGESHIAELTEYLGGADMGTFIRDTVLERIRSGARVGEATPENANTLTLELPDSVTERLQKLAELMYQRDAAGYAEFLLKASADRTPKEVRAFVFAGEVSPEIDDLDEPNGNGGEKNNPSKTPKPRRKVA